MSEADRAAARASLTRRLVDLVTACGARTVTCYVPLPTEPDTSGFLSWAHEHGVEVLLPVSLPRRALAWARYDGSLLREGKHGISEPAGDRLDIRAAEGADLMLIPACSVDAHGTRLGWGLGYYDRCLEQLQPRPPVYAVVFAEDLTAELPRERHDVPVDGVVTPLRLSER